MIFPISPQWSELSRHHPQASPSPRCKSGRPKHAPPERKERHLLGQRSPQRQKKGRTWMKETNEKHIIKFSVAWTSLLIPSAGKVHWKKHTRETCQNPCSSNKASVSKNFSMAETLWCDALGSNLRSTSPTARSSHVVLSSSIFLSKWISNILPGIGNTTCWS